MLYNRRFSELDALRGLAAVMVMIFHFSLGRFLPFHLNYVRLGNTGVDLFFMISGFVIFMSFDHISKSSQFIISRFIRLYPTYWTVVTFTFLLMVVVSDSIHSDWPKIPFKTYLGNLTMFQYYLKIPNLDGPYWTMIIEMNFYVLMVLLYRFKLFNYLTAISISICIAVQVLFLFEHCWLTQTITENVPFLIYSPLFFTGILFYQIISNRGNRIVNYACITFFFVCQIVSYKFIHNKIFMSQMEYAVMLTFYYLMFILLANQKLNLIVSRSTLFFGKISYPLYLIHQYLSVNFIIPGLMNDLHFRYLTAVFIAFITCTILATLITKYIESPIRRIGKKYIYSI